MSNTIHPGYGAAPYNALARPRGAVPAGRQGIGFLDMAARAAGQRQAGAVQAAEAPSLEAMLKTKYPNIHYHVFDASSGYWRTRNDYPHYLLYQDGDEAKKTLENWQPTGSNPFYGSIDGRFTAPKEIHALGREIGRASCRERVL